MLRLLQDAERQAPADEIPHVWNGAFVGRHEDQVILEFADLPVRAFELEDLGDVRRRLASRSSIKESRARFDWPAQSAPSERSRNPVSCR